jgi:hypothetical protein
LLSRFEVARLFVLYLVAGAVFIPFGVIALVLREDGVRGTGPLLATLAVGILSAQWVWVKLSRRLVQATVVTPAARVAPAPLLRWIGVEPGFQLQYAATLVVVTVFTVSSGPSHRQPQLGRAGDVRIELVSVRA